MAARHEEGCHEKIILRIFFVCKGLSNDDVGGARGTILEEIQPGAGFKTGDFVKEVGGATVERLCCFFYKSWTLASYLVACM